MTRMPIPSIAVPPNPKNLGDITLFITIKAAVNVVKVAVALFIVGAPFI
jgi:hypothetical protein